MYPGDPWVIYALRPDEARALAEVLSHERHDTGFQADSANLFAAADWAECVEEDDEDDERPGLVVVFDKDKEQQAKDEERRRQLWYDRPRGGSVTS
jgi:hypothetical protein